MKMRELAVPYVLQEVDYRALQEVIAAAFVEEFGEAAILAVRVVHFNPDMIDATVLVEMRQPTMDAMALQLSDKFRREGLRVAIDVAPKETAGNQ
jgi:hypothetical protein